MSNTNTDKNRTQTNRKASSASHQRKAAGKDSKKNKGWLSFGDQEGDNTTRNEYLLFAGGAFLCLFALYAAFSILSYLFTSGDDAKFVTEDGQAGNLMGNIGAYIAYFFVTKNFGYASIFITVFLFMAGLRIMFMRDMKKKTDAKKSKKTAASDATEMAAKEEEKPGFVFKIRLWKWFINCGILTIWFSCFLACLGIDFFTSWGTIYPGGQTGYNLITRLTEAIGPFRYVVLIVTAIAYLCYLSSETIHIIRRMVAKPVQIVQDKLEKNQGENEGETLVEGEAQQETYVDPETGEIINTNVNQEPQEDALEWEFRGGEDGPDHPETLSSEIDKNTATTIVFNVEGAQVPEPAEPGTQMNLFEDETFEVSTGTDEEVVAALDQVEENTGNGGIAATTDPDMVVTIGAENETADPDDMGALEPYDPKLDLENYRYPTLDLLKKYEIDSRAIDMEEQTKNKNQIITVLRNFGVEISSIKATVGPTITLYEITPAPGVRIGKIRNLEDDIALSLAALGIRIIAPIPGKGTVGIEVPNANPQIVSMESVINSKKFQESEMELPMALGKTITNEIFMADLAKMPHLLVAGATGQGKSVGLNAILTSLLYKKHPAELKIVMVDPKKVEFSVYSPLVNHFLAQVEGTEDTEEPIITDVNKVIQTLKSLCQEMDTRYDLLKKARARNLKEYNEKFKSRQLNPNNGHKFMPYIVVIIDEFGDLIMTAGKEIELPIARIAQLARAVGIHMIIATQRPTTNIITGTIKANFPARIAFKVSSMIDSRTILDRPGANQLVGKGDMLFLAGNEPVRVQCAFVDTPEVERINNFVACQQSYMGPFPLPFVEMEGGEGDAPDVDMNHLDPMFEEVARLVVSTQQGSTSMIQRKFSIGYNRAGRLMDQLEVAGIVGPAHGSKPREVLCQSDMDLNYLLDNLR